MPPATRTYLALVGLLALSSCNGQGNSPVADLAIVDFAPPSDLLPPPDFAIPLRDPKAHPDQPGVVYNGGRLLHHIQVVTAVWTVDTALADARHQFAGWMVDSTYFDQFAEYGVQRGTAVGPFAIADPPPDQLDDSGVGALLRAQIAKGTLPPPVADSLYILYLPPGTLSTMSFGQGCVEYDGYHWKASTGMKSPSTMAYAIIPTCVQGDSQFDSDTVVVSHEIAEAATDPEGTGYFAPDFPLSEIGDLCTPLDNSATVAADGGATVDYEISRIWSAQTALAGNADPCLPVPDPPYVWFNAGIDPNTPTINTNGAAKTTFVLNIEPFAYGSVGPIAWNVIYGPGPGVLFSTTKGQGFAGSTQQITITITDAAPFGAHIIGIATRAKGWQNISYGSLDIE